MAGVVDQRSAHAVAAVAVEEVDVGTQTSVVSWQARQQQPPHRHQRSPPQGHHRLLPQGHQRNWLHQARRLLKVSTRPWWSQCGEVAEVGQQRWTHKDAAGAVEDVGVGIRTSAASRQCQAANSQTWSTWTSMS